MNILYIYTLFLILRHVLAYLSPEAWATCVYHHIFSKHNTQALKTRLGLFYSKTMESVPHGHKDVEKASNESMWFISNLDGSVIIPSDWNSSAAWSISWPCSLCAVCVKEMNLDAV